MPVTIPLNRESYSVPIYGPLVGLAPVTPSDTVDFPNQCRQIRVTGGGGNIAMVLANDIVVVYPAFSTEIIDIMGVKRINQTETTATGIWYGW